MAAITTGVIVGALRGVWSKRKKIAKKSKNNWREILIAVLLLFVAYKTWSYNKLADKLRAADGGLALKEGEKAKVRIGGGRAETGGGVHGDEPPPFIPPESSTDLVLKENKKVKAQLAALNEQIEKLLRSGAIDEEALKKLKEDRDKLSGELNELHAEFRRWGFTFKPGIGVVYAGGSGFLPEFDFKFFYFDRWSLTLGFNKKFIGLGITRHVDDFIPTRPLNLEVQGKVGLAYEGKYRLGGGLRANF